MQIVISNQTAQYSVLSWNNNNHIVPVCCKGILTLFTSRFVAVSGNDGGNQKSKQQIHGVPSFMMFLELLNEDTCRKIAWFCHAEANEVLSIEFTSSAGKQFVPTEHMT